MNDTAEPPAELLQLLLSSRIDSYEQLEVLLLLKRCEGQFCPAPVIAQLTTLSESSVEDAGMALCQKRLAVADGARPLALRYAPAAADADALVLQLAAACQQRKLDVLRAMTAIACERLRVRAAETFGALMERKRDG